MAMSSMLIVFGGLPGTGKTALARSLAGALDGVHLRVDTIEQAIRGSMARAGEVGPAGYAVAYAVAEDNLRLGRIVLADCVNPLASTRAAWRAVARRAAVTAVEVEVVCSDALEHRRRIESRRADIAGLQVPAWHDVLERGYEPWAGDHVIIDTARRPVDDSAMELHALLLTRDGGAR